jgi:hypothetical protein
MTSWIIFVVAYLVVLGVFRGLGGVHSAADAFKSWGSSVSTVSETQASSGR